MNRIVPMLIAAGLAVPSLAAWLADRLGGT